ncbi:hypothetical protein [Pseudoalteromonas luteoviolacea]|uniref:JmjC domain-containing protein n=1 Tax=Pseudoalteromonas luteoviolacea S4060-1 TaxID=1365257 RepID=A0A161Y6G6_9GAMM|nr:hypothetical protein [Pseudoalteromonas luteoviolacea]KZN69021.1 hypothetical protein N478_12625 [Pseudoalteromonas luteoviolacea S4060-1]
MLECTKNEVSVLNAQSWWEHSKPLEEINVNDFTPELLRDKYIKNWSPLVIRGLGHNYGFIQDLENVDSFIAKHSKQKVFASFPIYEGSVDGDEDKKVARKVIELGELPSLSNGDFSINAPVGSYSDYDQSLIFSEDALSGISRGPLLQQLSAPRFYPIWRLFLCRGGFTPWHCHISDEHLTFQLSGRKDFALAKHSQMRGGKFCKGEAMVATLDAGDAIYIPPNLYHTVAPIGQGFGATLAHTFSIGLENQFKYLLSSYARYSLPAIFLELKRKFKNQ